MADPRLPPWPDELLDAQRQGEAVAFLLALGLPPRFALWHLRRWAAETGAHLDRDVVERIRAGA